MTTTPFDPAAIGRRSGVQRLQRTLPALVGAARAAIGVAHMVAPTRANGLLAGTDAELATTRAAARTFGVREIYVGGGLYAAAHIAPRAVRPMVRAGIAVDVWDTAVFATTADLPRRTRIAGCLIAGGFVAAGIVAELQMDKPRRRSRQTWNGR